ncbi:uncharacterized protein LOC103712228 [Phoenix dactylifera]|uniref:Uncharacterized protein LOC103712228 n=1 Tax=Phoenix dactylifera TaxID=42345 RepID=A0A8B7CDJ6_PHODC|nr:uncharacterized protein LOC103712228 [Phoenix dactylifera]
MYLRGSLPGYRLISKRIHCPNIQMDSVNESEDGHPSTSEESNSTGGAGGLKSRDRKFSKGSCRFQLEQDVQRLQKLLLEEMQLHAVLENAVEHAAVTLSDLSCLPNDAQELLSNIATLETTVSKLEEEMISLHFQLIQERNERRLAEYRLKQLPSQPLLICSAENDAIEDMLIQETVSRVVFQHVAAGSLKNQLPVKGLWNHPNQLSEEIVRCMKNIFVSLADCSILSSKSSLLENICSASPVGHLSNSSWSVSEPAATLSWVESPQVDLECNSELLAPGSMSDLYKVRGKLSWADIGNYSLATEVSWMSVDKKQLEYAAGALRRFRLLIEQLAEVNPIHLDGNEKLAFWINLYNALIMHAYLAYGVPRSDMKLFSLMQKAAYTVGGHSFSAACIEYVILKMRPPIHRPQTALLLALRKLKVSEEQRKFSIEASEPLVAFALSCGTYSSPAVKIYSPRNVREQLQEAQRDFIRASVAVSNKGKLLVPKMLHCFARGFVDDANMAVWISRFLPQQQAAFVEQCMSQRRQSLLGSRNCGIIPFDCRFRYLFLPEKMP